MPNRPSAANVRRLIALLLVAAVAVVYQLLVREPQSAGAPHGLSPAPKTVPRDRPAAPAPSSRPWAAAPSSGSVAAAFRSHARAAVVEGSGCVAKLLADDRQGSRHQRFLLRVDGGPTVLVAHNIDLAERVAPLRAGDAVRFRGEYVWNAKGGILHWTHADPDGRHEAGWIEAGGRRFQ